jgi:glycine/D-amino acid oxidase-like deaminating enzyme
VSAARRILVLGAGIVGVNAALALRKRGFAVTMVDDRGPGLGTSFGNAGCIAVAEITPISMPGLTWHVPRMLLDPLGPLAIRWQYLPELMPWLWRFWLAGGKRRVEEITAALGALVGRAWTDWDAVIAEAGIRDLFVKNGALFVYRTQAGFRDADYEWDLRRRHGAQAEAIDAPEIRQLEPALSPDYARGYFIPNWGHVLDPHKVVVRLAEHFRASGGEIRVGRARAVEFSGGKPTALRLEDGTALAFDALVVCAGAWSKTVCAWFGVNVPLDTERGYNTTLPHPGVKLTRPVCPAESSFLMTPMEMGLRIGGAVELAGLEAPPNYARAKALLELGRRALPGLDVSDGKEWMGFRPSMPDSMPVISPAPNHPDRVFFAFGHGHLGLTESATTGRLIAELVANETPSIDVKPFRIDRF